MEQTFDIYRNDVMIVSDIDATNYIDESGTAGDVYKVTPHGGNSAENDVFIASEKDYKDVILDKPEDGDGYTYEFNDAVTINGVQNDDGNKKPSGYITFTAPADGTLSLKFESSGTRTDGNLRQTGRN